MSDNIKDFIYEFNEYFPFERYILKNPQQINRLFDDIYLTELFIPGTKIKIHRDDDGHIWKDEINSDEIYIKVKSFPGEMRFALLDFAEHIVEGLILDVMRDFGLWEWQCLFTETDDVNDLNTALKLQKDLITNKYDECNIKSNFQITKTIELLKNM